MLDLVNSLACLVILAYCFIVAAVMPGGLEMLGHKVVIWGVTISAGFGAAGSFSEVIGAPAWHVAALNFFLAAALIVWRAEAMRFVKCKFIPYEPGSTPRRRATDWGDLDGMRAMNDEQMDRFVGGAG